MKGHSVLPMSPFIMLGGGGILATPSCSQPIFDVTKVSFVCAAEKPLISLAAARAGVRFLIPEEDMLQDPVLSGKKCLWLNLASLQIGL